MKIIKPEPLKIGVYKNYIMPRFRDLSPFMETMETKKITLVLPCEISYQFQEIFHLKKSFINFKIGDLASYSLELELSFKDNLYLCSRYGKKIKYKKNIEIPILNYYYCDNTFEIQIILCINKHNINMYTIQNIYQNMFLKITNRSQDSQSLLQEKNDKIYNICSFREYIINTEKIRCENIKLIFFRYFHKYSEKNFLESHIIERERVKDNMLDIWNYEEMLLNLIRENTYLTLTIKEKSDGACIIIENNENKEISGDIIDKIRDFIIYHSTGKSKFNMPVILYENK